jgi:hypothetical protein
MTVEKKKYSCINLIDELKAPSQDGRQPGPAILSSAKGLGVPKRGT